MPGDQRRVCTLAADAVMAIWAHAHADRGDSSIPSMATSAVSGLTALTIVLRAMGFRFQPDGKVALRSVPDVALPNGRELRICLLAARFIGSMMPGLADPAVKHDPGRVALTTAWNSFHALAEELRKAGYFRPCVTGAIGRAEKAADLTDAVRRA